MKLDRLFLYICLTAAVTVGIVLLAYNLTKPELPEDAQTLPYHFTVADYPGIDVGVDKFRLGAVTPSTTSYRYLSITDPYSEFANGSEEYREKKVRIVAVGPGSEWLYIEPTELVVPGVVKIMVSVPADASYGVYEGVIVVAPAAKN